MPPTNIPVKQKFPSRFRAGTPLIILAMVLPGCGPLLPSKPYPGYALFEDRCKNMAGEKIHRKIEDVEGILLINVREKSINDAESIDYPGAAFALEAKEKEYIETFLSYEHSSFGPGGKVTPEHRGYINRAYLFENPVNIPGYKFVDVIDSNNGLRYRYRLQKNTQPTIKWMIDNKLEKTLTTEPIPRYGVYFENHVIPSERASGLASTTIKVIDTTTKEILGEFTAYAYGGAVNTSIPNQRVNWLAASKCPQKSGSSHSRTRQFVDQVLIPKQDH